MSAITNLNPIQSINSLLRPLGLAISSKEQIIAKTKMVAFAALYRATSNRRSRKRSV